MDALRFQKLSFILIPWKRLFTRTTYQQNLGWIRQE